VNVPDLLNDLNWPWHVDMPVNDLDLGHLDNSFHVLNLRNMDLYNLFLLNELRHVPDVLHGLDWSRNMNMPLDHLHLRDLNNPLHMLDLRHWNVNDLLLVHNLGNVANLLLLLWRCVGLLRCRISDCRLGERLHRRSVCGHSRRTI